MKQINTTLLPFLISSTVMAVVLTSPAQSPPATAATAKAPAATTPAAAPARPAWLSDLSVGVKEGYDDNVLLVSGHGMKPEWSWITTVSPKIGINLVPLLGDQKAMQVLSFSYLPDFVSFHNVTNESYNAHRLAVAIKGASDAFSWNLATAFVYIDGSKISPNYPGNDGTRSVYATAAPRERRAQYQDRSQITFQYDVDRFFIRPVAYVLYYELLTEQRPTTTAVGYQNYCDRYDMNGGADLGFRVTKDLALTLGYRYGSEYQQAYAKAVDSHQFSSSSTYNRILLGIEGKPVKWLNVAIAGGPDFRTYVTNAPVNDRTPIKYYGEAALTATVTANDSFAFKFKGYQWVASTGKIPYFESGYDLGYRHKFSKQIAFDLGWKLGTSDYTSGNQASSQRDDWMNTLSAGLVYTPNANLAFNLNFANDWGKNHQDNVTNPQYRGFDHQLTSLGVTFKF